jgi:LysM repeat protein
MFESSRGRAVAIIAGGLISLLSVGRVAADGVTHTVMPGDTLSGIAAIYSVTVDTIAGLNGIVNPNIIFPGDILNIPGMGGEPRTEPGLYVVRAGDTLSVIAERYGVTVSAMQVANGLGNADLIFAGQKLVIPSEPPADPLAALPADPPSDPDLEAIIEEFAAAEGLDPGMVKALAFVESSWNQGARSSAGATGVMQLMPETAAWLERDVFGYELNEGESVYDNVKAGTRLLRILVDESGGDIDSALAAYYQGQGATSAGIMYDDTKGYVRFVHGVWERYWR